MSEELTPMDRMELWMSALNEAITNGTENSFMPYNRYELWMKKLCEAILAKDPADPDVVEAFVNDWLDDHPEATTTVEDGAVTTAKLADGAVTEAKMDDDFNAKLAKVDGSYEGMTVGNAEQLISSVGITDQTPYNFRTSAGSTEIGDREELNAVVGVSVPWKQLVQNGNFNRNTTNWTSSGSATRTVSNNVLTITSSAVNSIQQTLPLANANGHRILFCGTVSATESVNFGIYKNSSGTYAAAISPADGTKVRIERIVTISAVSTDTFDIRIRANTTNSTTITAENINVFDLTQMLGSTIADYIYSLEQSNAGAGVAWFRKYFPKLYYQHNSGALLSVRTNLHRMVGFNAYNPTTGTAKVVGGNQYQITGAYTALSLDGTTITPDANGKFTPSASGTLTVTGGNSTTTCVHLVWDGERNGEYEPYVAHEYALSDITLRGIPKLDANNNLYYDGDTYESDGTVTRKYAVRAFQSGDATDGSTMITDGTNTVYKLATPTTESADQYQQTQIVNDFGTEEFVDAAVEANERDVAIPVGHETFYQNNLKAKLEMAPNSPDGDGVYVVQQTNGENEYIPLVIPVELPTFPSDDGTYVLKITVSGGTVTKAWVEEEV